MTGKSQEEYIIKKMTFYSSQTVFLMQRYFVHKQSVILTQNFVTLTFSYDFFIIKMSIQIHIHTALWLHDDDDDCCFIVGT